MCNGKRKNLKFGEFCLLSYVCDVLKKALLNFRHMKMKIVLHQLDRLFNYFDDGLVFEDLIRMRLHGTFKSYLEKAI